MFKKQPGCTKEVIDTHAGYTVDVWVPPLGYGFDFITGEIEKTDIIKRSSRASAQYWERLELPADYKQKSKIERRIQKGDKKAGIEANPDHFDSYLDDIREKHWLYRTCGVWVYMNGKPVYITGEHWFYMNWWNLDKTGYPEYRDSDRRRFYFQEYCIWDDRCAGIMEASNRRSGKCFAKGTEIRMYDGSVKNVEDIIEGDLVMGDDSESRSVFGLTSGMEEMFKITPNRGNSFVCNKSHILTVIWNGPLTCKYFSAKKGDIINITIENYVKLPFWVKDHLLLYRKGWGNNFSENKHFIPSYLMGLFIGDGCTENGSITCADKESVDYIKEYAKSIGMVTSNPERYAWHIYNKGGENKGISCEEEINGKVRKFDSIKDFASLVGCKSGKVGKRKLKRYKFKRKEESRINSFRKELNRLGLIKTYKFIPSEYLIDSYQNRRDLLAGLIDSDGHLTIKGGKQCGYEITQKNKELALQIVELAQSLGYTTSCNEKVASMKRPDGSYYKCIVYRCIISGAYDLPCKIERKKYKETHRIRVDQSRTGFEVKSVGVGEYYGFAVDKNNLFLLKDGIVVHNSFRAGVFLYNYMSITADAVGGIQSKTGPDASKFFRGKLITPFKKLPDFFQPETNTAGGDSFTSKIEFGKLTRRGQAAQEDMDDLGLNSVIDWRSSEEFAYDGQPLHRCVQDEVGKESDGDPYERWGVVKECLIVGKRFVGKAIVTTTPEELKGMDIEDSPFYKLWHQSKPFKDGKEDRDGNGRTKSWLYAYYIPAWENIEVDKFGMPKKDANIEFIMNARVSNKKLGQKKFLDEMKKHTITEEEMFIATLDGNCMFNEQHISERLDALTGIHDHYTIGYFMWENGIQDTKVVFKHDPTGNWLVLNEYIQNNEHFTSNMVEYRGELKKPLNVIDFTMGVDPFDHYNVESGSGSKGSFVVLQKYNPYKLLKNNKAAVCIYLKRPKTPQLFYEHVLMTAVWFGCDFLYENNKIGIKTYCVNRGFEAFFVWLPGRKDAGVASSPELKQHGAGLIEFMVEDYPESFYFVKLLEQLGVFDIKNTEKYDLAMAYMYALISDVSRLIRRKGGSTIKEISEILPLYLLN